MLKQLLYGDGKKFPAKVEQMIENIEKYQLLKLSIKSFKDEFSRERNKIEKKKEVKKHEDRFECEKNHNRIFTVICM